VEFKKGDVVKLKSGGPLMTIDDIGDYSPFGVNGTDQAKCIWFEKTKMIEGIFALETLEVVNKP
jgi:uncharacterized protein YodC (DUF2158 family)